MAEARIDTINLNGSPSKSTLYKTGVNNENWGAYYLSTHPELYEPQRSNTFMLKVDFPENFFDGDEIFKKQSPYAYSQVKEVLRVAVSSSFVPHFSVETLTVKRGNASIKFAGTPTYRDGDIKVTDFIGAGSKDLAMAWQRKVYNSETEKVGIASDYKVNATLIEYTPDYQPVRSWIIYGAWISGLQEEDYSHESNNVKELGCTIQYDTAKVDTTSISTSSQLE